MNFVLVARPVTSRQSKTTDRFNLQRAAAHSSEDEMSNNRTTEQPEQPLCDFINTSPDDKLAWTLASPVLSELLDHAMFCADCSSRIQAIEDAEFESLSSEERAECDLLAAGFIEKTFFNQAFSAAEGKSRGRTLSGLLVINPHPPAPSPGSATGDPK